MVVAVVVMKVVGAAAAMVDRDGVAVSRNDDLSTTTMGHHRRVSAVVPDEDYYLEQLSSCLHELDDAELLPLLGRHHPHHESCDSTAPNHRL